MVPDCGDKFAQEVDDRAGTTELIIKIKPKVVER